MNRQLATIVLIESSVNKVSKGGKPYTATVLHYTVNGERKEKMVLKKEMRDRITQNFHANDTVILTFGKNAGGYDELEDISADDGSAPPATTTNSNSSQTRNTTYKDNSAGMQVGNALTNATSLMVAGVMKGSLEEVAAMVLTTGEKLKVRLESGEFNS